MKQKLNIALRFFDVVIGLGTYLVAAALVTAAASSCKYGDVEDPYKYTCTYAPETCESMAAIYYNIYI